MFSNNNIDQENMVSEGDKASDVNDEILEDDPIAIWVDKSPKYRGAEVEYLMTFNPELFPIITDDGDFQKAIKLGSWTFLLVLDKSFPKETEYKDFPIKIYMVMPNMKEIWNKYQIKSLPDVYTDRKGIDCINFKLSAFDFKQYLSGCSDELLSENIIKKLSEWITETETRIISIRKNNETLKRTSWLSMLFNNSSSKSYPDTYRAKYKDARDGYSDEINPGCQKVVLSDRAYTQIFSETFSKIGTETGGLLLGHFDKGIWYVVEASDPGINATFTTAYHEGDDVYENHICGVISRMYKYPLVFLGMWHRHPGSLDVFSGTDDVTNYKYAESAGNGCISALVNIDPDFRLTFYYVEQGSYSGNVYYTKVDIEVGNDKFENSDIMALASPDEIVERTNK